jgi:hypothetical protein
VDSLLSDAQSPALAESSCARRWGRCESHLQGEQADLVEIAARVTEVLADLILMAPPNEQTMMMADVVANLGGMVLEKCQEGESSSPRRSKH